MFTTQITETDLGQVQQVQRPENHVSLTDYVPQRKRPEWTWVHKISDLHAGLHVEHGYRFGCQCMFPIVVNSLNDIHEVICQRKCPFSLIYASVLKISNREYDCIVKN